MDFPIFIYFSFSSVLVMDYFVSSIPFSLLSVIVTNKRFSTDVRGFDPRKPFQQGIIEGSNISLRFKLHLKAKFQVEFIIYSSVSGK